MSSTTSKDANGESFELEYELVEILREQWIGDRFEQSCIRERKVTRGVAPPNFPRFEARILLTTTNAAGQVIGQQFRFVPFRAASREAAWGRLPEVLMEFNTQLDRQKRALTIPGQDVVKKLLERGL